MTVGVHAPARRIGFVCLLILALSTSSAQATPIEIVGGFLRASEIGAFDTGVGLSLSDGRSFSLAAPYQLVSPFYLPQGDTTVSIPLLGPSYPWSALFNFLHEPMSKPVAPDGETVVPFTMTGTLTACSGTIPGRIGGFTCVDPNTVDVIGQGTIRWSYQVHNSFPYQLVEYRFSVPDLSSSLLLLGVAFVALVSWRTVLGS